MMAISAVPPHLAYGAFGETAVVADIILAIPMIHPAFLAGPLWDECELLALARLTFQPARDTPLASVTVPVDIILIGGTTTLAVPTDEELFSFSIMSGHYGSIRMDYITSISFL